uniref:Uncharacterized protein n=1 Tax=Guillardia theta TaxID=55529 RepID=A0A7S4PLN8_GUITH|mmetsp:Transcript_6427/g.22942  ORF Transcript_6427/g.22942 Transcript_6427/m.22942 type:complete len:140 (+) Transcript_6427:100-519(+)
MTIVEELNEHGGKKEEMAKEIASTQRPREPEPSHASRAGRPHVLPSLPQVLPLTELCIRSICDSKLSFCESLENVPDHLVVDMLARILRKGALNLTLARKFQTSTCPEVSEFARDCIKRLHEAEISAGPLTPKGYGCRF